MAKRPDPRRAGPAGADRIDAAALWAQVTATVRPLRDHPSVAPSHPGRGTSHPGLPHPTRPPPPRDIPPDPPPRPTHAQPLGETLDGGWDRRIRRGAIGPERTIDLHGHTLATAQAALDRALADAVADDIRTLLVVTGKPPRGGDARRGLIRAGIHDWLAHSAYGARIAAVRAAHPRHGGAGALYLILRRRRG